MLKSIKSEFYEGDKIVPEIVIVPIIAVIVLVALIVGIIIKRRRTFAEVAQTCKYIDELFNNNDLCSIIEKQASSINIRWLFSEAFFLPANGINVNSQKFNDLMKGVSNTNNHYLYLIKSFNQATREYIKGYLELSTTIQKQLGTIYSLDNVKRISLLTAVTASDNSKQFLELFELYDFLQKQNVIKNTNEKTYFLAFLYIVYFYEISNQCKLLVKEVREKNIRSNISLEEYIQILYDWHALENNSILLYCVLSLYYQNNYQVAFSQIVWENEDKINRLIQKCADKERLEKLKNGNDTYRRYSMLEVDKMNGQEFENFVTELFVRLGYQAERTKLSGDQGVDVIAKKGDKIIAIQAKHYNQTVGNHAIMEVVAGAKIYNATLCYVVTNNYFTKSAKEMANAHNVILWDRDKLIEKLSEI